MKVEVLQHEENSMKLLFRDVNPAFVNTLRRILLAEVPKLAIETVDFYMGSIRGDDDREYESKTPMFDEIIAHRLGLVPIPTDLELFSFRDDCTCAGVGCPNCELIYSLRKVGPCTVYSGDLELTEADEKFSIKEKLIPIVKLNEKQALMVYATAVLGTGKDHAKWQAAHAVGYRYYPMIDISDKACEYCGDCVEACPRSLIELKGKKLTLVDGYEAVCNLCNACEESCEADALKVNPDNTAFVFQFETDGSLSASEALGAALSIALGKFEEFRESLSEVEA